MIRRIDSCADDHASVVGTIGYLAYLAGNVARNR